jgi:DNA-binding HxlR family transcriptional regulator
MACSTIDLLNILGKKWDATILEEIINNEGINFDKLISLNPKIYPKTLNKALSDLIKAGLITKNLSYSNKMKRSEYKTTESGRELDSIFKSLKDNLKCNGQAGTKECRTCEKGPNGNNLRGSYLIKTEKEL